MTVKELKEQLNKFEDNEEIGLAIKKIDDHGADVIHVADKTTVRIIKEDEEKLKGVYSVSVWIEGSYEG